MAIPSNAGIALGNRTHYRADIDGLRAIAVLSVLIYHAFPSSLSGGFVGVDIFFVISGYLITGSLLDSINDNQGSQSVDGRRAQLVAVLTHFYHRRIKRIFPALLVVTVFSTAYAWLILFPKEFSQFGKHLMGNAAFVQNFILYNEVSYFDVESQQKPFLHIWSLAIEEQFYIVWPLLLFFVVIRKWSFRAMACVALLASLAAGVYYTLNDRALGFYSPLSRFWELVFGGMIAWSNKYGRAGSSDPKQSAFVRELPPIAGVLLIAFSCIQFSTATVYPGFAVTLPTLGAALIVNSTPTARFSRVLGCRPMAYIGLISYPLYLWHWPLLSFSAIVQGGKPSTAVKLAAAAASVALASLTFHFIEKTVRFGRTKARTLLLLLLGLGVVGYAIYTGILEPKSADSDLYARIRSAEQAIGEWEVYPGLPVERASMEVFKLPGSVPDEVVYLGDSNMKQYWVRIEQLTKSNSATYSAVFITRGGCAPIRNVSDSVHPDCGEFADAGFAYISKPSVKRVVIAGQWAGYFSSSKYQISVGEIRYPLNSDSGTQLAMAELASFVADIQRLGKEVVLIAGIPIGQNFDPKNVSFERTFLGEIILKEPKSVKYSELHDGQALRLTNRFKTLLAGRQVTIIDPAEFLCRSDECAVSTSDGAPIYKDATHLRPTYVRTHATFIDRTILK